jgi:omega-3 fatty acid desaturase (delta-15 desaturase)
MVESIMENEASAASLPSSFKSAETKKHPTISELRKAIPQECFEKNLLKSLYYMARDFAALGGLVYSYKTFAEYGPLAMFVWCNLTGFFMWCLFVVGHDCGHTSFSNYQLVNNICGHICHAPLLVPFWPWKKSHQLHHMYHNHLTKDMSHPWLTAEYVENELSPLKEAIMACPAFAFVEYTFVYLMAGIADGSHYLPTSKLFADTTERIQCAVSSLSCIGFMGVLYWYFKDDVQSFWTMYFVPLLIFNMWLIVVTYLQHHEEDTVVYEEGEWNYLKGAFETVDRTYGFGIDDVHHNITDGHVTHHIFFTQIPHYNLTKATAAIRPMLKECGVYKQKDSRDFLLQYSKNVMTLRKLYGKGVLSFKPKEN